MSTEIQIFLFWLGEEHFWSHMNSRNCFPYFFCVVLSLDLGNFLARAQLVLGRRLNGDFCIHLEHFLWDVLFWLVSWSVNSSCLGLPSFSVRGDHEAPFGVHLPILVPKTSLQIISWVSPRADSHLLLNSQGSTVYCWLMSHCL
jgi:hypothetical protein